MRKTATGLIAAIALATAPLPAFGQGTEPPFCRPAACPGPPAVTQAQPPAVVQIPKPKSLKKKGKKKARVAIIVRLSPW